MLGVLLGMTLATLSTWADLEANFYGFTRQTKTPLQSLTCPVMISMDESREVTVKFTNTAERTLSPVFRAEISTPILPEFTQESVKIEPGASASLTKIVGPKNIDLRQFIFVKVLIFSTYPLPNEEGVCGIYVLPLRGSGRLILSLLTMLSLGLTGAGASLLRASSLSEKKVTALWFTGALTVPSMAASFIGWWVLAAMLLVALLFMVMISLSSLAA